MNKLQLALPVMLHSDNEPDIFRTAQERLVKLGDDCGVPLEVGAFLLYLPAKTRTPENFEKQLKNQEKHRLPIRLVETGVQRQNALSYGPSDPTYNPQVQSDLELVIEQAAKLRDLDPTASQSLIVAPHIGIIVLDSAKKGDFSKPGLYSVADFVEQRDAIYNRAKTRFAELSDKASVRGLKLAIENAYSAVFENIGYWQGVPEAFGMGLQVFNDFQSFIDISRGNIVLDVAHFAAMKNIPARYKQNRDVMSSDALFATLGINSWDEFEAKAGKIEDYFPKARALHLSSQDGLSIRVPAGTEIGRRWGDGTDPDLTTMATYHQCLDEAISRGLPVAIEEAFNTKPLTYKEADAFLEPILRSYANRK